MKRLFAMLLGGCEAVPSVAPDASTHDGSIDASEVDARDVVRDDVPVDAGPSSRRSSPTTPRALSRGGASGVAVTFTPIPEMR